MSFNGNIESQQGLVVQPRRGASAAAGRALRRRRRRRSLRSSRRSSSGGVVSVRPRLRAAHYATLALRRQSRSDAPTCRETVSSRTFRVLHMHTCTFINTRRALILSPPRRDQHCWPSPDHRALNKQQVYRLYTLSLISVKLRTN